MSDHKADLIRYFRDRIAVLRSRRNTTEFQRTFDECGKEISRYRALLERLQA